MALENERKAAFAWIRPSLGETMGKRWGKFDEMFDGETMGNYGTPWDFEAFPHDFL